jgi:hypothetical protein
MTVLKPKAVKHRKYPKPPSYIVKHRKPVQEKNENALVDTQGRVARDYGVYPILLYHEPSSQGCTLIPSIACPARSELNMQRINHAAIVFFTMMASPSMWIRLAYYQSDELLRNVCRCCHDGLYRLRSEKQKISGKIV